MLNDLPKGEAERRILVREITGNCREKLVSLVFGTLPPQKGEVRAEIFAFEVTCDLVRNRGLSRASLTKENEPTFKFRILDPLDDIVQEMFPCARKTGLLIVKLPASLVRQFSDYCISLCPLSGRGSHDLVTVRVTHQHLMHGSTSPLAVYPLSSYHPAFEGQ
jgi:hypothetical protein